MMNAILSVGLEPALGFYHQPRSQAAPLALDLMEIFRVSLVDMIVVASVNRLEKGACKIATGCIHKRRFGNCRVLTLDAVRR